MNNAQPSPNSSVRPGTSADQRQRRPALLAQIAAACAPLLLGLLLTACNLPGTAAVEAVNGMLCPAAPASTTAFALLTLSPKTTTLGEELVTITGRRFAAGELVVVSVDGAEVAQVQADCEGVVVVRTNVAVSSITPSALITARGQASGNVAEAKFAAVLTCGGTTECRRPTPTPQPAP